MKRLLLSVAILLLLCAPALGGRYRAPTYRTMPAPRVGRVAYWLPTPYGWRLYVITIPSHVHRR